MHVIEGKIRAMPKWSIIALLCVAIPCDAATAVPIRGPAAVALLGEIWMEGRDNIYPRALASRFTPETLHRLTTELQGASSPPLADVLNPFLDSLGVSHTHFYDVRHHEYYMLRSLFSTRDMDEPKLDVLGVQLDVRDGNRIRAVMQGLPADRAGLRRGDRIAAVDGAPFASLLDWQGGDMHHRLTIERPSDASGSTERLEVTVVPRHMGMHRALLEATKHSVRTIACRNRTLGYLQLWSGTDARFLEALHSAMHEQFADVDGVILDLRDGYGGAWWPYLDPFFEDRRDYFVAQVIDGDGAKEPHVAEPHTNPDAYTGPMAVLINSGTRSGKESLAHQFVKTRRATVIGTRTAGAFTAGKGVFADRDAKYMLYLSVFELRLDGRTIEGVGVAPHVRVPPIPGVDAPLKRAREVLGCEQP
jgi:carboxyl-terminal processing protease